MKTYLFNVLVALDQFINTLLVGSPDETLSARAWRAESDNKILGKLFRPVIDFLFLPFETHHCFKSWQAEVNNKQLPKDYQQ